MTLPGIILKDSSEDTTGLLKNKHTYTHTKKAAETLHTNTEKQVSLLLTARTAKQGVFSPRIACPAADFGRLCFQCR